jgi:hypothetical protein
MRRILFTTIATALATFMLVATVSVSATTGSHHGDHGTAGADIAALRQLQADFHESISGGGNIDELMSLWTDDASFTAGGSTYHGKTQIRAFFLQSPGFTHNWVSMTPAFKTRFHVHYRTADIYFECHFVDWQANPQIVVSHTSLSGEARKVRDRWLFSHVTVGTITLTP